MRDARHKSFLSVLLLAFPLPALALQIAFGDAGLTAAGETGGMAMALKILLGLTVLTLAPAILVVMTSFTRIVIVLAILRHAFGMQQTPPNTVLISLALFLTVFNMWPVFNAINDRAFVPYMQQGMAEEKALSEALGPMREFMVRQTREQDLALMVELSKRRMPESVEEIATMTLIPAFMLSELKTAFQIGFVVFLPFLLIDIVVASVLMSMGMMMVPPMTIALPIKILMFILIDGWNILARSLLNSFQ